LQISSLFPPKCQEASRHQVSGLHLAPLAHGFSARLSALAFGINNEEQGRPCSWLVVLEVWKILSAKKLLAEKLKGPE
jgi:hypothetical protein